MLRGLLSVCVLVCLLNITMSSAKAAEPNEMSFGMWTRVGPSKYVLDEGPDLPEERPFGGGPLRYSVSLEFFDHLLLDIIANELFVGSFISWHWLHITVTMFETKTSIKTLNRKKVTN